MSQEMDSLGWAGLYSGAHLQFWNPSEGPEEAEHLVLTTCCAWHTKSPPILTEKTPLFYTSIGIHC